MGELDAWVLSEMGVVPVAWVPSLMGGVLDAWVPSEMGEWGTDTTPGSIPVSPPPFHPQLHPRRSLLRGAPAHWGALGWGGWHPPLGEQAGGPAEGAEQCRARLGQADVVQLPVVGWVGGSSCEAADPGMAPPALAAAVLPRLHRCLLPAEPLQPLPPLWGQGGWHQWGHLDTWVPSLDAWVPPGHLRSPHPAPNTWVTPHMPGSLPNTWVPSLDGWVPSPNA